MPLLVPLGGIILPLRPTTFGAKVGKEEGTCYFSAEKTCAMQVSEGSKSSALIFRRYLPFFNMYLGSCKVNLSPFEVAGGAVPAAGRSGRLNGPNCLHLQASQNKLSIFEPAHFLIAQVSFFLL